MNDKDLLGLFIAECVDKKDKMCLSHPLNTKLSAQFEVFKKAHRIGKDEGYAQGFESRFPK